MTEIILYIYVITCALQVIDAILSFDAHDITDQARSEVKKLLKSNGQSFQHEVIHRASVAGSPLAKWVQVRDM